MNQTWENSKKPSFGPAFGLFWPLLVVQENGKKPNFGPNFGPFGPNSGCHNLSSKIWLCQSLDIMLSYHHVQYQKKTNDPILRKLSDGSTDGQTDKSDFIGSCPTNVERPKI